LDALAESIKIHSVHNPNAAGALQYELLNIINSNQSTWSGGFTTSNMVEQIKREVATTFIDKSIWNMRNT